jgi:hypothetical protein
MSQVTPGTPRPPGRDGVNARAFRQILASSPMDQS